MHIILAEFPFRVGFLDTAKNNLFAKLVCNLMANENMTDDWLHQILLRLDDPEISNSKRQHDSHEFLTLLLDRLLEVSFILLKD